MAGAHTLARRPALLPPVPRERPRKEAKRERGVARPGATLVLVPLQRHESLKLGTFKPFGPKFLSFLEHKVLPAIEGKHRIDSSQRVLTGSSAGGLFSVDALLERPELFQSVLALSPATGWGNKWLFAREKEYRKAHPVCKRTDGLQTNSWFANEPRFEMGSGDRWTVGKRT